MEWISVKDRLPKGLEEVLIMYFGDNDIVRPYITIGIYIHALSVWRIPHNTVEATKIKITSPQDVEYDQEFITHWMSLTELYKLKKPTDGSK